MKNNMIDMNDLYTFQMKDCGHRLVARYSDLLSDELAGKVNCPVCEGTCQPADGWLPLLRVIDGNLDWTLAVRE